MARRRKNPSASAAGRKRYDDSHWGIKASKTWVKQDGDLPTELVEMGKLRELRIDTSGDGKPDIALDFKGPRNVLAFDIKRERLYNVMTPAACKRMKQLWEAGTRQNPPVPTVSLAELAVIAGGSQQGGYPRVTGKTVGYVTHVIYSTHKKGDGPSNYIHECGEESGVLPLLVVDSRGRLWWAGGNYTVPDAGITD